MKGPDQETADRLAKLTPYLLGTTGSLAAILGLVGLVGWAGGGHGLTTLGAGKIPISPMAGALLLALGMAVVLQSPASPSRWSNRCATGLAGTVVLVALVSLGSLLARVEASWEHLGFGVIEMADIPLVGHMLPATAIFFALAGLVFVLTQVPRFASRWTVAASLVGSFLLWAATVVFLFRYLMDAHPLVPTDRITPALVTVLGMAALSLALLLLASRLRANPWAGVEIPRLLFWGFALLGTVIVAAGSVYYNRFEKQFSAETGKRVVSILDTKAKRLAEWRAERLNDGGVYFENSAFASRLRRLIADPRDESARRQLLTWLSKSRALPDYDQFLVLNPAGEPLLSQPERVPPANPELKREVAAAVQTGRPILRDVHWREQDGRAFLAVIVPLAEEPGQPSLGTAILRIDPSKRLFPVVSQWPLPAEPVELVLIRRDGDRVTLLNAGPQLGTAAGAKGIPMSQANSVLVRATASPAGIYFGMNVRGEPVLAAARSIKDSPWIVVAMVNPVQLGGPLRERVWAVALLVAVVLFGVGAALSLVWRQQRAGLLRDQLKVAEALRASEGRFRQVLETISLIGVMLDAKGNIVLINDYLLRLTGWRAEELRERNWFETFLPPEIRTEIEERIFLRLIQDGVDPMHFENEILTRSGERRLVAWNNTVLRDGAGVVTGVASIGEDITDRRQAEGKLLASLREKEALLKEVHHRVKNNLQIVASLLRLESGRSEHLMTKYVLQEMHGRIRAMALLHESLYRNAKFDRIDLAAYLRQLVAYLGRSLGSAAGAIQFDLKFDALEVGADEAIPCGLIINELVTNSVKHGFPNGGTGVVTIELQHAALPGEVQLRVRDSGVGLPAGFDPATVKSLGMQLVADLARQLGGRLAVGPGTMFTVAFKVGSSGSIQVKAAASTKIHG